MFLPPLSLYKEDVMIFVQEDKYFHKTHGGNRGRFLEEKLRGSGKKKSNELKTGGWTWKSESGSRPKL